jgi:hypothetical protein
MRRKLLLFFVVFVIYYLLFYFEPGFLLCVPICFFWAIDLGKVWAINAHKVAFLAVLLAACLFCV